MGRNREERLLSVPSDPLVTHKETSASKGPRRPDALVLILLGAAVVYTALLLDRGWIPHDERTIGETPLRVLEGQLPHPDFSDVYTGGLAYWNALSFVLFGVNLLAPRILPFLSFGVSSMACLVAGRRAVRVDPGTALREE